jgi:hypothetical protein
MKFSTYADALTPDHPRAKEGAQGELLKDILDRHDGRYELRLELPEKFKDDLRRLAELTSDKKLAEIADAPSVIVPLDHLRHLDPNADRIVYGARISREPGDGPLPGFDR